MNKKFEKVLADLSLQVTKNNVNKTCTFIAHQPKMPAGCEKLRKVK
ncbi:MAG: hypothetical protein K0S04_2186 [Herbinix sp.]|jgi:cyclic lactone autoinducer peptide|nr:hypothetical protein [Herbinix sp.]